MTSMRISTSLMYQRGVDAIESQQVKLSKTEQQLATGERLGSPADDPFASTRIVALEEEQTLLDQYNRNSDYAMTRLQQEETALTSAINALQRLRELAVQTANGIYSAEDRRTVSEEAYQIRDGLLQVANTTNFASPFIDISNITVSGGWCTNSWLNTSASSSPYAYNYLENATHCTLYLPYSLNVTYTGSHYYRLRSYTLT